MRKHGCICPSFAAESTFSEFARVYGVDFYSVLTRGSQFKVESFMFKISKPENFMLPSPSREDVGINCQSWNRYTDASVPLVCL